MVAKENYKNIILQSLANDITNDDYDITKSQNVNLTSVQPV